MMTSFRVLALGAALAACTGVVRAQSPATPAAPSPPAVQAPSMPPAESVRPAPTAKKVPPRKPTETKADGSKNPECAWVGRRIVSLLARDDVDAAGKFVRFYEMFGCPAPHVGAAFRCVVADNGTNPKALGDRVDQCWERPSMKFLGR